MAAPYLNTLSKLEQVAKAYLIAGGITNALTGKAAAEKGSEAVICYAESGVETPKFSGNKLVNFELIVRRPMVATGEDGDPKPEHDTLVATVFDRFCVGDIATELNAAAATAGIEFTAFYVHPGEVESGPDGNDCWIDKCKFEIYCCASVIA